MIFLSLLIIIEIFIRLFKLAPKIPKGQNIYEKSDILTYALKADITQTVETTDGESFTIKHNGMGLRDDEHTGGPIPLPGYRILALGDSFTYGWGVEYEETFLYELEKWLEVDIIKAGIPGYEMRDCRKFLGAYHDFYKPDMVLVCVAPNDALCLSGKHKVTKDGSLVWDNFWYKLSWILFRYSHLARIIIKFFAQQEFPLEIDTYKIKEEILAMKQIAKNIVVLELPDRVNPRLDLRDFCKAWDIPHINAYFNDENCFLKDGHCNIDGNYTIAKLAYNKLYNEISRQTGRS